MLSQIDELECSDYSTVRRIILYLFTAIGLSPGGSGYFTCEQNMKVVTTKFKSGGLHELPCLVR
jgi:hypothetical protein